MASKWLTSVQPRAVCGRCVQYSYHSRCAVQTAASTQRAPAQATGVQSAAQSTQALPEGHIALIDASYYCFKYHHAFGKSQADTRLQAAGADGSDTAIQHMFLKFVLGLVLDSLRQPSAAQGQYAPGIDSPFGALTGLVVVFDSEREEDAISVRRELCPEYKANRGEADGELSQALRELPGVLRHMGINCLGVHNVEADDIIATLATAYSNTSKVTIYSADKDFKQLVGDKVCMVSHIPQGTRIHTLESFSEDFGFDPCFFVDFQALTGDKSDNVSGVRGIGDKTAKALIQKHSTLENLFTALHTLKVNSKMKNLKDAGFQNVVLLRSIFQLQKNVRTVDGTQLPDMVPFGAQQLLHEASVEVDAVKEYCGDRQLKQVLERFQEALGMMHGRPQ